MCISGASPISSGHPLERDAKVAYAGRRGRVELPGEHLWNANRGPERVFFNADFDRPVPRRELDRIVEGIRNLVSGSQIA